MKNFLEYLRNQSPQAKGRIILGTIIVVILVLGLIWYRSLANSFTDVNASDLLPQLQTDKASTNNNISIEAAESRNGKKLIYFKVMNDTDDILTLSQAENISLSYNGQSVSPELITDRQQGTFVQKELSHSTSYGILVFPDFDAKKATIVFDNMYFENSNTSLFKETMDIDFTKLKSIEELRS